MFLARLGSGELTKAAANRAFVGVETPKWLMLQCNKILEILQ